jgi:hypothetical protein
MRRAPAEASRKECCARVQRQEPVSVSVRAVVESETFIARYVLREHARGRSLGEMFEDTYVRNWLTSEQRRRVLDLSE